MNRLKRDAILLRLIERLRAQGSWCGETHVQKATFFLQELHFSQLSDLRSQIRPLKSPSHPHLPNHRPLRSKPRAPYGPTLVLDTNARQLLDRFPNTLARHDAQITFVATASTTATSPNWNASPPPCTSPASTPTPRPTPAPAKSTA